MGIVNDLNAFKSNGIDDSVVGDGDDRYNADGKDGKDDYLTTI